MEQKNSISQKQNQKQKQRQRLIYAFGTTMVVAIIACLLVVFNVGNIRSGFAAPTGSTFATSGTNAKTNWTDPTTWGKAAGGGVGVGYPGPNDVAEIHQGDTVLVNGTLTVKSMLLGGLETTDGTLSFASTGSPSLTVSGNIIGNTGSGSGFIKMVSGGTLTVDGNITSSTGDGITINMASNSTLSTNYFSDGGGGLTPNLNAGTVNYNGTGTVTATSYNNLTITEGTNTATLGGTTTVNGTLTITSGTLAASSKVLNVKGAFVDNGTFTGTAIMNGASAQTIDGTTAGFTIPNLNINNQAGVTLLHPMTVSGALTLTTGVLKLGSNKLIISPTGSITGASSTDYIETNGTGALEMTAYQVSGTFFPVGDDYDAITVQPTTADAIFDVSVSNGVTDRFGTTQTTHAVGVTWKVVRVSGVAQKVTISPQWNLNQQLTSFAPATSRVSTRTTTSSAWTAGNSGAATGAGPYIRVGSIASAVLNTSYYVSVEDNVSALPVTLTSFTAEYANNTVALSWTTASEINNNFFDIERSTDGQSWQTIGRSEGHGNSTTKEYYNSDDNLAGIVPSGSIYYRLKQVDYNGSSTYSMIRSVSINNVPGFALSVFPNPAVNEINVNWNCEDQGNNMLTLVNVNGAVLYTENITGSGNVHKQLDLSKYPPGTYFVQVVTDKKTASQTIIKK